MKAFTLKKCICFLPNFLLAHNKRPAMRLDAIKHHTNTLCLLTHSCCPGCDNHVSVSCAGRSGVRQCQRQPCRPRPRPRHHTLWCSHVRRPPLAVTGSHASDGAVTMTAHSPLQRGGRGNKGYWGIGEELDKRMINKGEWGRSHRGNKVNEEEERVSKGEFFRQTKRWDTETKQIQKRPWVSILWHISRLHASTV